MAFDKYTDYIRYKVIKDILDGKTFVDIEKEYGIYQSTASRWIHSFIEKGSFNSQAFNDRKKNEIIELHKKAVEWKKPADIKAFGYDDKTKYEIIKKVVLNECTIYWASADYEISSGNISEWIKDFIQDDNYFKADVLEVPEDEIVEIKKKAIKWEQSVKKYNIRYDNNTKLKMIEELCNGNSYRGINREYGINTSTLSRWLKDFIKNGLPDDASLSTNEKIRLNKLHERAKKRAVELKLHGTSSGESFEWLLDYDQNLKEWQLYAEEWIKTITRNKSAALKALANFFKKYIIACNITRSVLEFVSAGNELPDFYEIIYSDKDKNYAFSKAKITGRFIDWILEEKFSVENDYGNKLIPAEFHNPLTQFIPEHVPSYNKVNSDKNVLPYRYIKILRNMLVPSEAMFFSDLTLAHNISSGRFTGGDWYIVDESIIDRDDPDCVWRKRKATYYEKKNKNYSGDIYEMWCPARTICLFTKLMLPIRTYQARMLDSGEMDTFKYVQKEKYVGGEWVKNDSLLSQGTEKKPYEAGVFRKFIDPTTKLEMTGFYINTNKTADINKDEGDKGYNMPWQYEEVLYWLAKLRDWQKKYNPIEKPTKWTSLGRTQLGEVKDIKVLKERGQAAFLFRDATSDNKDFPFGVTGLDHPLWYKLLLHLQNEINENATNDTEKNLKFVRDESTVTTYYPLHSLRVSLITAYALEGGVPMPILSKCIAGHARLVMTLYYTKMGISYVTDTLNKAELSILEHDKESFSRFIKDAKYKQLECNSAVNDNAAYDAILSAQKSKASIVINDKGICPKGCFGCDTGGTYINDDTDKITYGVVQGYPDHNCVRCRWFITGPAFLPGLVNHFNVLSYDMAETAKRINYYQTEYELLENRKYEAEQHNEIFEQYEELLKYEQLLQLELQKGDDIANNMNATLRLIDKCQKISKNKETYNKTQLVPVGTVQDVGFLLETEADEMYQLQTICNGAELFPETDASKALLKRSQIIDLTLMFNKKQPVMFKLSEKEQLIAGNKFMRLLIKRSGSLKDAIPYAIGRKKLEEIGICNELEEEIKGIEYTSPPKLLKNNSSE